MREFDRNGLLLASFQAKLFEASVKELSCSSPIFLRRFKYSEAARELDNKHPALIDLDVDSFFSRINEEYNETEYGEEKYNESAMHWLGYIYRYICYTRECSTKYVFSLFPPSELINRYYVYHTQSEEWVIEELLELKDLDEDVFDKNKRLKKIMLEKGYAQ